MVSTLLQLFGKFWPHEILRYICLETNYYAIENLKVTYMGDGGVQTMAFTRGGEKWYAVIVK